MGKAWTIIILVLIILVGIYMYNRISGYDEAVQKAWKPIDAAIHERYDSIPRLIPAIELYAGVGVPEAKLLKDALPPFDSAESIDDKARAANRIENELQKLFQHVKDRFPGITESNQVESIKATMDNSLNQLNASLGSYNKSAETYNSYVRRFPNDIIAKVFGFTGRYEYLEPQF